MPRQRKINHEQLRVNLQKLPIRCATILDGEKIIIERGVSGSYCVPKPGRTVDVDAFNKLYNVTPAQQRAMLYGMSFGFDTQAADPDEYQ